MKRVLLALFLSIFCCPAADTLSVLYFENTTKLDKHAWLSKGLADMLITDLSQVPQIKVVEREELQKVLKEQALSQTGLMDQAQAVKVGKLLNARKLVMGGFMVTGKKIRIDAKISDVETGNLISSAGVAGKLKGIFELEKDLAKKLIAGLALKPPKELGRSETQSVEAVQQYYEGITFLDDGQIDKALAKFTRAKELDPLYLKPQKGLEAAYQFLKDFKKLRQQREICKLYQFADKLRTRLALTEWTTYADIIMSGKYTSLTPKEQKEFNEENDAYIQCNTPAQCAWRLMLTLWEIGNKALQYFNDAELNRKLSREAVRIADESREKFKGDDFLPEILGFQITVLSLLQEYDKVKAYGEEFMVNYPDYRMIETVENHYQKALDALSKKE